VLAIISAGGGSETSERINLSKAAFFGGSGLGDENLHALNTFE
jgi:hypothetical protein